MNPGTIRTDFERDGYYLAPRCLQRRPTRGQPTECVGKISSGRLNVALDGINAIFRASSYGVSTAESRGSPPFRRRTYAGGRPEVPGIILPTYPSFL